MAAKKRRLSGFYVLWKASGRLLADESEQLRDLEPRQAEVDTEKSASKREGSSEKCKQEDASAAWRATGSEAAAKGFAEEPPRTDTIQFDPPAELSLIMNCCGIYVPRSLGQPHRSARRAPSIRRAGEPHHSFPTRLSISTTTVITFLGPPVHSHSRAEHYAKVTPMSSQERISRCRTKTNGLRRLRVETIGSVTRGRSPTWGTLIILETKRNLTDEHT